MSEYQRKLLTDTRDRLAAWRDTAEWMESISLVHESIAKWHNEKINYGALVEKLDIALAV